jgi:hypothetical protein
MHPLLQAIRWNNEGARLVQLGELQDATWWIHHAALVVESVSTGLPPGIGVYEICTVHDNDDDLSVAEPPPQQVKSTTLGHEQESARRILQQMSESAVSVHQQPIVLSTNMIFPSVKDAANVLQATHGAILFNLALVSHLSGLTTTPDAEELLDHALELYHCSLGLLDSEGLNGSDKNYDNNIWACCILNNMAHIHNELGECDECLYFMNSRDELITQSDILDERIRTIHDACNGR